MIRSRAQSGKFLTRIWGQMDLAEPLYRGVLVDGTKGACALVDHQLGRRHEAVSRRHRVHESAVWD